MAKPNGELVKPSDALSISDFTATGVGNILTGISCSGREHAAGALPTSSTADDEAAVESTDVASSMQGPSPALDGRSQATTIAHCVSKSKTLVRGTAVCDDSRPSTPTKLKAVQVEPAAVGDDGYSLDILSPPSTGEQDKAEPLGLQARHGSVNSDVCSGGRIFSRDSGVEYRDNSGVDLLDFLKKTLTKSDKDRQMLLRLEQDFKVFVDSREEWCHLAEMCSYDRMVCHRLAAFYGLSHNIDKIGGRAIIISRTSFTRIPSFTCEEHVHTCELVDDAQNEKKLMLLKKPVSLDERSRSGDKTQFAGQRTKSLEERQKSYDESRKRIFGFQQSVDENTGCTAVEPSPFDTAVVCRQENGREWSSNDSSGYMSEDGTMLRPVGTQMLTVLNCGDSGGIQPVADHRQCGMVDSVSSSDSPDVCLSVTSPGFSQSPVSVAGVVSLSTKQQNTDLNGGLSCCFDRDDPTSAHASHATIQHCIVSTSFIPPAQCSAEAFGPHLTAMQVAPGGCSPVDGVPVMLAVSPHSTYPYSLQHDQFHSQSFVGQPLILSALPTCSHQPYLNAYVPSPMANFYQNEQFHVVAVDNGGQCVVVSTANVASLPPGMVTLPPHHGHPPPANNIQSLYMEQPPGVSSQDFTDPVGAYCLLPGNGAMLPGTAYPAFTNGPGSGFVVHGAGPNMIGHNYTVHGGPSQLLCHGLAQFAAPQLLHATMPGNMATGHSTSLVVAPVPLGSQSFTGVPSYCYPAQCPHVSGPLHGSHGHPVAGHFAPAPLRPQQAPYFHAGNVLPASPVYQPGFALRPPLISNHVGSRLHPAIFGAPVPLSRSSTGAPRAPTTFHAIRPSQTAAVDNASKAVTQAKNKPPFPSLPALGNTTVTGTAGKELPVLMAPRGTGLSALVGQSGGQFASQKGSAGGGMPFITPPAFPPVPRPPPPPLLPPGLTAVPSSCQTAKASRCAAVRPAWQTPRHSHQNGVGSRSSFSAPGSAVNRLTPRAASGSFRWLSNRQQHQ